MNRESFTANIKNDFKWLNNLGYETNHVETSVYFEKKTEFIDQCISFSWAEYNEIKIHAISARKRFIKIEKLIESITGKFDYTIRLPLQFTSLDEDSFEIVNPSKQIHISSDEQTKELSNLVRLFFNKEALPFFNRFETLSDIEDWLNRNEVNKHSALLSVNNNSMMLRKLIILKEVNALEFKELYDRYKNFLINKNKAGEKVYQEMYSSFIQFDDYFKIYPA